MKQWEYKIIESKMLTKKNPLDEFGKEGWELISSNAISTNLYFFFKRELQPEPEKEPEKKVKRWQPKKSRRYFYVSRWIKSNDDKYTDPESDVEQYEVGNCFRTEEQAERAAQEVKALFSRLHEEFGE